MNMNNVGGQVGVVLYPNLTPKGERVADFESIKPLIKLMSEMLEDMNIPSISAPSLGQPLNLMVLRGPSAAENFALINTKIVKTSSDEVLLDEWSPTAPGVILKIKRPRSVSIRSTNMSGESFTFDFDGFTARAILHEMDRINGRQFKDSVSKLKWNMASKKYNLS